MHPLSTAWRYLIFSMEEKGCIGEKRVNQFCKKAALKILQHLLRHFTFSKVIDLSQVLPWEFYKIIQSSCSIEQVWKTASERLSY